MTIKKEFELKIVKFIDYIYLNNYITNMLIPDTNVQLTKKIANPYYIQEQIDNDWKIFSAHYIDESLNILYFIKKIKSKSNFNIELLLLTLHIYSNICKKHAHKIENYTYLFASVYIGVNKIICVEYLTDIFIAQVLNIPINNAKKMVNLVDKFMDTNDIYFGIKEKEGLINNILST
jgi:hypothetical protein